MTLLDEAKKLKTTKRIDVSDEKIELALAWLKDEIGISAICRVCKPNKGVNYSGNMLYSIAVWLREAYRKGLIKIKKLNARN